PWIWMADGPHGVRKAPETYEWGYGNQHPATCFPTASALAATWDTELIYQVGQKLGDECQALGVNILLGPGVNIKRSPLGGRNFEYFSEDPMLAGKMGAAFINGVQDRGVGTSLKHYVANNVETRRMHINSDVDNRTLHEIYLRPFEIAVKESKPWTVMACYNRVQGTYGTQSPYLLTEILRDQWGFEGIVISDWEAVVDRVEALKAGMHVQMPGHEVPFTDQLIVEAVQNGNLDEKVLDDIVTDILTIVYTAKEQEKKGVEMDEDAHHAFARQVAAEAITLLKNDDDVLPINKKKYKKVAIIGEFAASPRYQGNGSSEVKPTRLDAALDVITEEYGKTFIITYARGYNLKDDNDFSQIEEAADLAANSDIALVFAGLPLHYESEGIDRTHIDMPEAHNRLIAEIQKNQENTVVVLTNGSAIAMPWADEVSGIVETWLGGQAGAGAVADVLFGKVNPSGKLAETFPYRLEDSPAYLNFPGEEGDVLYGERMFVGYRYYDSRKIEPMFPFGFGLSYTTFEYSGLKLSNSNPNDESGLTVSFRVKNTGEVEGKEVVQLYVRVVESSLQRPVKELKGFEKIELAPGEEKEVKLNLSGRDFSYYDSHRKMWIAESGEFEIMIGASSADIRLSETITLQSTQKVPLAFDEYTFLEEFWAHESTRQMIIDLIPNALKTLNTENKPMDEFQFDHFIGAQPVIKLPYFSGGEASYEDIMELVEKTRNLTYTP
ncbi:MAG: glycoside hydrolase family 3 C-terminal domain-containing protein, partial [bacterium]